MNFSVRTDCPVAFDSLDHTQVKGSGADCFHNMAFCHLVDRHFGGRRPLFAMDLGCAGGCHVEDLHRLGWHSVGLEGSDYSQKIGREAWGRIPDRLFTCDISRPFQVLAAPPGSLAAGQPVRFHLISSWDCFEHIPEGRVPQLMRNVADHLAADGLVLLNIPDVDAIEPWHVNLKPRAWWDDVFSSFGFEVSQAGLDILRRERVRSGFETAFAYQWKEGPR